MNYSLYEQALDELTTQNQLRSLPHLQHLGQNIFVGVNKSVLDRAIFDKSRANVNKADYHIDGYTDCHINKHLKPLVNIASNDYLAFGTDSYIQTEFYDYLYQLPKDERPRLGSASSRLLTGNDENLQRLEIDVTAWYNQYHTHVLESHDTAHNLTQTLHTKPICTQNKPIQKQALILNSGYHANLGVLPAIAVLPNQTGKTAILADKLVHASIIDGMQLASMSNKCSFKRYQHNDYIHLQRLVEQVGEGISRIIIVTESVFSMDGDLADLTALVAIKKSDNRVELYVDEAHGVGVFGATGLGLAEATNTLDDIDYVIGTFGKAFASMGAYIICHTAVRQWLINRMRPFIYSTALPPITHAWTRFILPKVRDCADKRLHLMNISQQIRQAVMTKTGLINSSESPIIPYVLGDNQQAIDTSMALEKSGFYALAIRPPTVPVNTARIRLVMNAGIHEEICQRLIHAL